MTPAINLLKKQKYSFKIHKYDHDTTCTNYGKEASSKLDFDENQVFKTIFVSGGKRGIDIELNPKDLKKILDAKSCKITA